MSARAAVIVVGGGLAGITAALDLADAGARVTLLESRPRLGGATYSFSRGALTVDTGQHVFLRSYTAYRALLQRLGTAHLAPVQRRLTVPVLCADGRSARLSRDQLPAPLHLARSLATYRLLSPRDRLTTARTAAALRRLDLADPRLDESSFGAWLSGHGASAAARRAFWDLFTVAALNGRPEQVSLALAAYVFRRGLFDSSSGADLGIPRVPLAALHGEPAAALLTRLGVDVRTRARVNGVRTEGGDIRGGDIRGGDIRGGYIRGGEIGGGDLTVDVGGEQLSADGVVVALPPEPAAAVLAGVPAVATSSWAALGAAPIVNVHVHYDRAVTMLAFAAVVGGPLQWFFDRTDVVGVDRGQWLSVSLSAAERYVDTPTAELREIFLPALHAVLPAASAARVLDFTVTRERRATFCQAPGSHAFRPAARTGVPGLALAGAWTDTGWPDTMEGAVRSGHQAAAVVASSDTGRSSRRPPARDAKVLR